jgi:aerobic-type carbon monoxide dehydrogenase small subunit (CoxS/CutS family)
MIMAIKALLHENRSPTKEKVREAISGHLCRCGTYSKIIQATIEAAKTTREVNK